MMRPIRVLYNPKAHLNQGLKDAQGVEVWFRGEEVAYVDMTVPGFSHTAYIKEASPDTMIIYTGGDGTLNYLANTLTPEDLQRELYFFPAGTGNDFLKDIKKKKGCEPFLLNPYFMDLPEAVIEGKSRRFVNGVGLGLDAYACVQHEKYLKKGKNIGYSLFAFTGLLYGYKPVSGRITVDGVTQEYKKIWLAPVMLGTYFGGGFPIAPGQDRLNPEKTLTSVVVHDVSRLKAMLLFLPTMLGKGARFKKALTYKQAHSVEAEFDRPVDLQCDGEVISGISHYELKNRV